MFKAHFFAYFFNLHSLAAHLCNAGVIWLTMFLSINYAPWPITCVKQVCLFFLIHVACFLNVSLDAVVNFDLFVAKNILSGTPLAKNSTVSDPVYTSSTVSTFAFLAVEQAEINSVLNKTIVCIPSKRFYFLLV